MKKKNALLRITLMKDHHRMLRIILMGTMINFIYECPSRGFWFFFHGKLEDALFECFRDAPRIKLHRGLQMQLKMTTNANMPYTTCYPLSPPLSIWRGIEMWTFEVSVKLANQMASMAGLFVILVLLY